MDRIDFLNYIWGDVMIADLEFRVCTGVRILRYKGVSRTEQDFVPAIVEEDEDGTWTSEQFDVGHFTAPYFLTACYREFAHAHDTIFQSNVMYRGLLQQVKGLCLEKMGPEEKKELLKRTL